MRYSSAALVLAAAIVGRAAAGPHPRHAQFHDKRLVDHDIEGQLVERDLDVITVHITATVLPDGRTVFPTAPATPTPPPPPPTTTSSVSVSVAPAPSPVIAAQLDSSKSSGSSSGDLTDADKSTLVDKLGFAGPGKNAKSSSGGVWIGSGGPYTNTFQNNAGVNLILVVWNKGEEFLVHANTALITSSLPVGSSLTISFAVGQSGGWAAVYPDTGTSILVRLKNTIGEYTFTTMGAVDVSRMHTMSGHSMSITGPTRCVSDMHTCVFTCSGVDPSTQSSDSCWLNYHLENCSGEGSQFGFDSTNNGDSGGCSWNGNSAAFTTTFS